MKVRSQLGSKSNATYRTNQDRLSCNIGALRVLDMWRLRKTLTYLLTYLISHQKQTSFQVIRNGNFLSRSKARVKCHQNLNTFRLRSSVYEISVAMYDRLCCTWMLGAYLLYIFSFSHVLRARFTRTHSYQVTSVFDQ